MELLVNCFWVFSLDYILLASSIAQQRSKLPNLSTAVLNFTRERISRFIHGFQLGNTRIVFFVMYFLYTLTDDVRC